MQVLRGKKLLSSEKVAEAMVSVGNSNTNHYILFAAIEINAGDIDG